MSHPTPPLIMKFIVKAVLSQAKNIKMATSAYINNLFINEDIVSVNHIAEHLSHFGLTNKDPEWPKDGAKIVGLALWRKDSTMKWSPGKRCSFFVSGFSDTFQYADGYK